MTEKVEKVSESEESGPCNSKAATAEEEKNVSDLEETPVAELKQSKSLDPGIIKLSNMLSSGKVSKVAILTGAGVSTSAGIPDFRSHGTGLYANLQKFDLPMPESIFDIDFFKENPEPFYALAKELYPGNFEPTVAHHFFNLLAQKELLLRLWTQNIDCLDRMAGTPDHLIIEAHGSFATARCIVCQRPADADFVKEHALEGRVPKCGHCKISTNAYIKPDIVFFGEGLPKEFFSSLRMLREADCLIVLGTSLKVSPFSSLIDMVPQNCPRFLFNLEKVGEKYRNQSAGFDFARSSRDFWIQGNIDANIQAVTDSCRWSDDLQKLTSKKTRGRLVQEAERDTIINTLNSLSI